MLTETSEADFIRAVLADPEDDAPRLIYADWLDEEGQGERAEFIRVQVALARTSGPTCYREGRSRCRDPECYECVTVPALRRRERELLDSNMVRWAGKPVCDAAITGQQPDLRKPLVVFRRGFVEFITCTAEDWLAHADAILATQPVREVTLTTEPDERFVWAVARWPDIVYRARR